MADYGMKVSKPGFNVTSNNPSELGVWSKYPMIKVRAFDTTQTITIPDTTTLNSVSIPHGLSYVPIYVIYIEDAPSSGRRYMLTSGFQPNFDANIPFQTWADLTNIHIQRNLQGTNQGVYHFTYYIFYDSTARVL